MHSPSMLLSRGRSVSSASESIIFLLVSYMVYRVYDLRDIFLFYCCQMCKSRLTSHLGRKETHYHLQQFLIVRLATRMTIFVLKQFKCALLIHTCKHTSHSDSWCPSLPLAPHSLPYSAVWVHLIRSARPTRLSLHSSWRLWVAAAFRM